jgi:hypothetical protein
MRSVLVASLFATLAAAIPLQGFDETPTARVHPYGDESLCLHAVDKGYGAAVTVRKCDSKYYKGWKAERFGDNGVRFVLDPTIFPDNDKPTIKQQQCLDIGGVSSTMGGIGYHPSNGYPATLHPCRQGSHNWPDNQNRYGTDFVAEGSNFFVTYNGTGTQQNFCLDADPAAGNIVQAWECNGSTNQVWAVGGEL